LNETFEGAGGFDNPGWTHAVLSGTHDWAWSAAQAQSSTHSWYSASEGTPAERVLTSPAFAPQAGTALSFWHTFSFDDSYACFDGGTLEISTDGGSTWSEVPAAAFVTGSYNDNIESSSNPLAYALAWCHGALGAMTQVKVDLSAYAGKTARLRWHEGDDDSYALTGWYIDSVNLATTGACTPNGLFSDGFESGALGTWNGTTP
jgi:bacillopeptidase F (M6 metalloprotease family)